MGEHLHSKAFPKGEEGCELLGRQLLDHCRHRHSGYAGPGSCQIPIAAVRQRNDSA
jgi:hypothetical protein